MKNRWFSALRFVAVLGVLAWVAPASTADEYGLPRAKPESVGMSSEKLDAIPAVLQPFIDRGQLPGFVTAVARDGKVVHFEAFGLRDVEREKPMEADTIFRMYSMTKPVTGVAVMILVDEGKVALSDPLSKYLPEFTDMKVLVEDGDGSTHTVPADKPITLWHLMTHTSGLIYGGLVETGPLARMYIKNGVNPSGDSGLTLEEFSKKAASMPLFRQPGTEFNYGISIDILGRVVEVVTGQRFGDFLQERVFGPLGMKDSGFYVPAEKADRFAANYSPQDGAMRLIDDPAKSPFLKKPSLDSGGGGMVGTAADYLRFAQMLVNGGELDGVRILSEDAVEEMTTNHLGPEFGEAPLASLFPVPLEGVGFGYCGAVVKDGYERTMFGRAGQYGWGGYASTDFWIDRDERLVGLILTQLIPTGTYPTRPLMMNATDAAIVKRYGSAETD